MLYYYILNEHRDVADLRSQGGTCKANVLQLPLRVNISGGTSGKKIVLRLDYGYYDECSPESRKGDKLIIKVK